MVRRVSWPTMPRRGRLRALLHGVAPRASGARRLHARSAAWRERPPGYSSSSIHRASRGPGRSRDAGRRSRRKCRWPGRGPRRGRRDAPETLAGSRRWDVAAPRVSVRAAVVVFLDGPGPADVDARRTRWLGEAATGARPRSPPPGRALAPCWPRRARGPRAPCAQPASSRRDEHGQQSEAALPACRQHATVLLRTTRHSGAALAASPARRPWSHEAPPHGPIHGAHRPGILAAPIRKVGGRHARVHRPKVPLPPGQPRRKSEVIQPSPTEEPR